MKRDLTRLTDEAFDVVVVGGGIQGAWIAWDAALRGLRVALIEQDDFGAATSANSLRIVHGGLRYLARGDLRRMQVSIRERSALLRTAPTLVEPLAVLVPTEGLGTRSRPAFRAALAINDLLSRDRNRGLLPERHLPDGRVVSLEECRRRFPAFPASRATGGALWYDARVRKPERLTLALVKAAAARGAVAANYCRAEGMLFARGAGAGVVASDGVSGGRLEIRGRRVVISAGPWTPALAGEDPAGHPVAFALNLEVAGRLADAAVGVRSPSGPAVDPVIGGHRFIFLVPQDSTTLLGTWYAPWPAAGADPGALIRRGAEVLLAEFRTACPGLELEEADVVRTYWGLLPLKQGREPGRPGALADRDRVAGHRGAGGSDGMFSVEGVKFTTARGTAELAVDAVLASLRLSGRPCRTLTVRLDDGSSSRPEGMADQIRYAIREEMAVRLSDVILRRSSTGAPPGSTQAAVAAAARIAAGELGWSLARERAEIDDVLQRLAPFGPAPVPDA
jgi:glycerol-3-phosphate dehydrogenase